MTRQRNRPSQVGKKPSNVVPFSVREFFERFADDDACLSHIMEVRYGHRHVCGNCGVESTFHKLSDRRAYSCAHCGDHVYPCAGTIFQDSRTPLQTWFYAIYLFVTTRHGVSGKELQRTLGVTYKCAYRIGMQIRSLMKKADGFEIMQGHVELDETYFGAPKRGKRGRGAAGKTIIIGAAERGGRTVAKVVPSAKTVELRALVQENISKDALITTDEFMGYHLLKGEGYKHGKVNHSAKEYVYPDRKTGIVHHTNTIESFWSLFGRSIRSTHIHISPKYTQKYLDEFTFRADHRSMKNAMFDLLIGAV
jgi:transposase